MPEEIVIGLVILAFLGWVLLKVIGALFKGLDDAQKNAASMLAGRRARRFDAKKAKLASLVHVVLPSELSLAEKTLGDLDAEFKRRQPGAVWTPKRPAWDRKPFSKMSSSPQRSTCDEMDIADINSIIAPDRLPWLERESAILAADCSYPGCPPSSNLTPFRELPLPEMRLQEAAFNCMDGIREKDVRRYFSREESQVVAYNQKRSMILSAYEDLCGKIASWNAAEKARWTNYVEASATLAQEELNKFHSYAEEYAGRCNEQKNCFEALLQGFKAGTGPQVIARIECVLSTLSLPDSVPRAWKIDFDENNGILIAEIALPDVVHRSPIKTVRLKVGAVRKPLSQTERKEIVPKIHPAILLRVAFEILRSDKWGIVKLLALNGWVDFIDPATGTHATVYTASLLVKSDQVMNLNLPQIDPLAAFQRLNGKSAGRLIDIIPIEPTLNFKRTDSRFVDAKAVLSTLDTTTNLAAMNWQDFEHLIRELFEKEFAGHGAEVKITQASRDRGVDAIAFDPDPIHGGKYVIQAKRYTDTVEVSAVRDLCAVVHKEGASRGILVTTSTYGSDAYEFANNEPITLLNGAELLGLLKKHGYSFRINLQEARRLQMEGNDTVASRAPEAKLQ
jgi:hypothetical protein